MDSKHIIRELENLCKKSGEFIRKNFGTLSNDDIETKSKNSLVSFVDKEAEKMIVAKLRSLIPDAEFYTEEDSVENAALGQKLWIVDPLDGTSNYISGVPHFSISIALSIGFDVQLGVVYDVMQQKFYHAIKGKGAFRDHVALKLGPAKALDQCMIATGFPYDKQKIDGRLLSILNHYIVHARGLRRLGSAALDLVFVAEGTFDLYYERFLNPWDIAAGSLIVTEAGGKVSDFQNSNGFLISGEIIACNKKLNSEAERIVSAFAE